MTNQLNTTTIIYVDTYIIHTCIFMSIQLNTYVYTQVHTGTAHGAPPPQLGASPAPGTATLTPQTLSNVCVQLARCQGSQLVGTGNPPTSFPP